MNALNRNGNKTNTNWRVGQHEDRHITCVADLTTGTKYDKSSLIKHITYACSKVSKEVQNSVVTSRK